MIASTSSKKGTQVAEVGNVKRTVRSMHMDQGWGVLTSLLNPGLENTHAKFVRKAIAGTD